MDYSFGERVLALLNEKGINQRQLAEAIGVTEATISRYMTMHREPKVILVMKMAEFFGVSTDYLLFGSTKKGITGNEYQRLAARTIRKDMPWTDGEMHALHGMVGEIGELHSLYQKVYQGHCFCDDHAMKELGDLMWFIAEYCTINGWDLEDVMQRNIDKLIARYPEGFEAEKSLHRAEGDI